MLLYPPAEASTLHSLHGAQQGAVVWAAVSVLPPMLNTQPQRWREGLFHSTFPVNKAE